MGVHDNLEFDVFPNQSNQIGQIIAVSVITDEGSANVEGTIVRDDVVDPLIRLVELEDGQVVVNDEISGYMRCPQGSWLDRRVRVIFKRNTSKLLLGTIVRDDIEEPFQSIIKLDVGRFVLTKESQYSPTI